MTIDEINKKINTFEDVFVSDVRDIINCKYPNGFSFYIPYGNIHDDTFIDINTDLANNEKIYTYIKVTNEQMFNKVSVFVQLKNLINQNVNFQEVLPFIETLKTIYQDNLHYSKTKLYFNCKGSIHSGKFTYRKYGTEFYATKSQILKGKYRESYSDNTIKVKPFGFQFCHRDSNVLLKPYEISQNDKYNPNKDIPLQVSYNNSLFRIATHTAKKYESDGKYVDAVAKYGGCESTIYFESNSDINLIQDISRYLCHCCSVQGFDCFIKKDGTVDLIDNHTTLYPRILLNHMITKTPIPQGIKFGICEGHFDYSNMGIDSLIGCPDVVYGDFNCSKNNLKNLIGIPSKIYGVLNISYNPLTNLAVDNVEVDVYSGKINYQGTCIEKNYI